MIRVGMYQEGIKENKEKSKEMRQTPSLSNLVPCPETIN